MRIQRQPSLEDRYRLYSMAYLTVSGSHGHIIAAGGILPGMVGYEMGQAAMGEFLDIYF
jgi:hypothetical protein